MPKAKYHVRAMTRKEVDIAVDWAREEGWNPGLHDAECFYATDPNGFFIATLDGEIVGTVSAVAYGATYGFLGFYIVKPEHRGAGAGALLAMKGMERLKGRIMGLDGVLEQQENYKKARFELAYSNIRYAGRATGDGTRAKGIVDAADVPFEELAAYDDALFGVSRRVFLRLWISRPLTRALVKMQGDRIAGYGVIRKCHVGYKIGPLFAENRSVAEDLYQALSAAASENSPVFLDTPEVNAAAVALAEKRGMAKVFETARMYSHGRPDLPLDQWFGVTSFELG